MNERNRSKKGCRVVIYLATNPVMDYSSFLIKSQSNNAFTTLSFPNKTTQTCFSSATLSLFIFLSFFLESLG